MGRPKGSKNKLKVLKSPFKAADKLVAPSALVEKIRYLAARGLHSTHIATLAKVPLERVSPGGDLWHEVEGGAAEGILAVAEKHYERVLAGKSTHEVMFYLRAVAKFAETPEARKKVAAETGASDEISGVDVSFDDTEYDPEAYGEGEDPNNPDDDLGLGPSKDDGDVEI